MTVRLHTGDNRLVLPTLLPESVDACVTDPPYDLLQASRRGSGRSNEPGNPYGRHGSHGGGFMGLAWDATGVAFDPATWAIVYDTLKPGAHLVAFGGTRTFHRLTCAIEDAGFEIRDCLAWMYGSGFPKSRNLDGEWEGWGSALKPAWEPIILARKPLAAANLQANAEQYGTGALNVDGCRIGADTSRADRYNGKAAHGDAEGWRLGNRSEAWTAPAGRWPANVCLDEEAAAVLDAQTGTLTSGDWSGHRNAPKTKNAFGAFALQDEQPRPGDSGGASRFFYCAKADRAEREAGLYGTTGKRQNQHPTVKPIALMRWLVRLVTPPNGVVLDPFMGSGSTGCAAVLETRGFIGIEQHPPYVMDAEQRIRHWGGLFADVEQVA